MGKNLIFENKGYIVEIYPNGRIHINSTKAVIFDEVLSGLTDRFISVSLGINNSLKNIYDEYSKLSPLHFEHNCLSCSEQFPISQESLNYDDDLRWNLMFGFIGYCDRRTAVITISIYDKALNKRVFDSTFSYHGGMIYGDLPMSSKTALKVPETSSERSSILNLITGNYFK